MNMHTALKMTLFLCTVSFHLSAQTVWGNGNSRTETRNNAGLQGNAGALSGFFETMYPQNYPDDTQNAWWHLLDIRHSEPTNNFAMQFAGSFFDQQLYFRKTDNDPARAWRRVISGSYGTLGTAAGNTLELMDLNASTAGNLSYLKAILKRHTAGTGWEKASTRLQCITDYTDQAYIDFNPEGGPHALGIGTGNNEALRMDEYGNIGIGTKTPQSKLAVNGDIFSKKVKVTQTGWPDYVFDTSYRLAPLSEVEDYISRYKKLPEMPSAEEVEQGGLDLGATQALLLKKIEELTLYILQQQKEIEALKKQQKKNTDL